MSAFCFATLRRAMLGCLGWFGLCTVFVCLCVGQRTKAWPISIAHCFHSHHQLLHAYCTFNCTYRHTSWCLFLRHSSGFYLWFSESDRKSSRLYRFGLRSISFFAWMMWSVLGTEWKIYFIRSFVLRSICRIISSCFAQEFRANIVEVARDRGYVMHLWKRKEKKMK